MRKQLITLALILFVSCSIVKRTSPEITEADIYKHLSYLASDKLEGRRAGTRGAELAAKYIASYFKKFGLEPAGDDGTYFQSFDFVSDVKAGDSNRVKIISQNKVFDLKPFIDFTPLGFSASGKITGELVFAGYGISDSAYDDYKDINIKGKIALILTGSPDRNNQHSRFFRFSSLKYKVSTARSKGARGVVFFNPPGENDEFEKFRYEYSFGNSGVIAVQVKRKIIEKIFKLNNLNLNEIVSKIDSLKKPNSVELNTKIEIKSDVKYIKKKIPNIVGVVRSTDPEHRDEFIVIGAHYDHLGWGGQGSLVPDTVAIHNGADDNASGTSGLLELAEIISHNRNLLKRSVLFIAFTAEEEGTIGSGYFVNHPTIPLDRIIAMVNMDMIGRLKDKLTIYGVGTSPVWKDIIEKVNEKFNFKLNLIKDGYGPSDHAQFYLKNIPVLHFFTGLHSDYHKPSDDYDKINYPGERKVLEFIYNVILELNKVKEKPKFVKTETRRRRIRGFRVYLGIIPDYSESETGLKISGVNKGSPAEKAGLKAGDIIIKLGDREIKNIYDLTYALGDFKPGDVAEVVVLRNGKKVKLKVKFASRRR